MTNLDTRIIYDANGKPIPQYLDVTDKTDGSAGTMKPITKNSYPEIQDVNVTNQLALPTDYPDSAVKQELELIKAQQQQILERLDAPIPTQVTGSNVENIELIREETLVLRTESEHIIGGNLRLVDVRKYKDVSILFHNAHDTVLLFSVQGKPMRDGDAATVSLVVPNTNIPAGATVRALSNEYELLKAVQPYLRIRVATENTSPTSGNLRCWIFGSVR